MYGQQPPQAVPPQQKSNKGWLWGCLGCGGLAVVILIVGAGCMAIVSSGDGPDSPPSVEAGDTPDSSSGGNGSEKKEAKEDEKLPGIGDTVESGAFAFTVTDVETGVSSVGDNPYLTETPDGEYVIVHVTVENVGDQAGTFDSMSQKLIGADGKEYSTDSAAQISVDTDTWINEINPGNSVDGQLVFDVPSEVEPGHVELHDFLSFDQAAEIALK